MLSLHSLLIGSDDPKTLGQFYGKVLLTKPSWQESGFIGYTAGAAGFIIGPHDKVHGRNQNPERILINFEVSTDLVKEFERIKAIAGASVVQIPYHPGEDPDMQIATFSDPDGNYFQIATPMRMQA